MTSTVVFTLNFFAVFTIIEQVSEYSELKFKEITGEYIPRNTTTTNSNLSMTQRRRDSRIELNLISHISGADPGLLLILSPFS